MYDTLLVPTDGSEGTTAAATHAFGLADTYDATVVLVSVVDTRNRFGGWSTGTDPDEPTAMDRAEAEAGRALQRVADEAPPGVTVESHVERGVPHEVIVELVESRGIDLVVMGTHGRTGVKRQILGSVTERVLRLADAPVLAVGLDESPATDESATTDESVATDE